MAALDLSFSQRAMLAAIRWRTKLYGYPPSIRELCGHLEVRSTNGVREQLVSLAKRGFVDWKPHQARTLRLTRAGSRALGRAEVV